jgi:DNA-binding IclR family transcriptional regulator
MPKRKPQGEGPSQPIVNALVRGLQVLRCFDYARKSLGSREIARLTGMPQPTVWRLCKTLEREGYLVADGGEGRFSPGLPVLTLGYAALEKLDLAELMRPQLEALANRFQGATGLVTRDRLSMLFLLRCEGANAYLNVTLRAGSTVPIAHSGTGWGYIAGLSDVRRESLLADIGRKQAELWRRAERPFHKAFDEYKKLGYIVNADIFFNGLTTVAVPVGRPEENSLYVIYCTCLTSVLGTEKLRREAGRALSDIARKFVPVIERSTTRRSAR